MSPSAFTAPRVARKRADRIATRVASLAVPWITPPPLSLRGVEPFGEVEQLAHPVEHQRLDLGARRGRDPAHALHAEPGGQQLAEDRRVGRVGREVGEEARVLPLRQPGHDDPVDVGHHRVERLGLRSVGARGAATGRRRVRPGRRPGVARRARRSRRSSRSGRGRWLGTPRGSWCGGEVGAVIGRDGVGRAGVGSSAGGSGSVGPVSGVPVAGVAVGVMECSSASRRRWPRRTPQATRPKTISSPPTMAMATRF